MHTMTFTKIKYAYYDMNDGVLDVLQNDEYHPEFRDVAVNLTTV